MSLHITNKAAAGALEKCLQSAYRRFKHLPATRGSNGLHLYPLAVVLPTLKRTELEYLPALFAAAKENDAEPSGNPDLIAKILDLWLQKLPDTGPAMRLEAVRSLYAQTLADQSKSLTLIRHSERLRLTLAVTSDTIVKHVMLNTPLPTNFTAFTLEHAFATIPEQHHEKDAA
ncbi:MAG: hypothetical protein ACSHWQ_09915 [Spongiibacteraceae bacterium]